MIAFIGLGNPGARYAETKHNFGFWVADELARRWNLSFFPGKGDYVFAEAKSGKTLLAKPTAGMNQSGAPVREIRDHWGIALPDLYIIVDDVDLPLGFIRIRPKGGDGCHQGMASIIYHLGDTHFPRIRVGIGTDEEMRPAEHYVLKPFRKRDESLAAEMMRRGADACESILARGVDRTMSEYNRIEREGIAA